MAAEGAHVIINHPDADTQHQAHQLLTAIQDHGGSGTVIQADVRDQSAVAHMVAETISTAGRLDILVNNAAVYTRQPLADITLDELRRHLDINVQGPLITTQAAAPHIGQGGRIINLSSGLARRLAPMCSAYAATKAAVEAITRSQAAELGPRGITVNAIAPGIVETPMLQTTLTPAEKTDLIRATALGRVGEPNDIARVIVFLASQDAGWISGQVIDVDGGLA
jgi:3-oxoacyl-[acyl-carrier protein] reductase